MRLLRLYLIGMLMGIADLIPGVSGGTVAFLAGIYDELLLGIQSLQFHSFKKIAWSFLLPLGGGIITSILLLAKLFCFLLSHFQSVLFAFFFGLITASIFLMFKKLDFKKGACWTFLMTGALFSLGLTFLSPYLLFGSGFWGLIAAGMLGSAAMLLPGISGSFILQVLGVYPLILYALTTPSSPASLFLLTSLAIGIALGLMVFSRLIRFLLNQFEQLALSLLTGFMGGGLRALWPFKESSGLLFLFLALGFFTVIILEFSLKRIRAHRSVSN